MRSRPWTEADEAVLKVLWPGDPMDIGRALGHTTASVRARARLLGLRGARVRSIV